MSTSTELLRVRATGPIQITEDIGSGTWYVTCRCLLSEEMARTAIVMAIEHQLELVDHDVTMRIVGRMHAQRVDLSTVVLGGTSHFGPINTLFAES